MDEKEEFITNLYRYHIGFEKQGADIDFWFRSGGQIYTGCFKNPTNFYCVNVEIVTDISVNSSNAYYFSVLLKVLNKKKRKVRWAINQSGFIVIRFQASNSKYSNLAIRLKRTVISETRFYESCATCLKNITLDISTLYKAARHMHLDLNKKNFGQWA